MAYTEDNKRGNAPGGGAPTVSYTPTETTIPSSLYTAVPNLQLYKQLTAAERDVDLLISRKALEFQAVQQKTVHPASIRGEAGILRVFVYNTCENQPWQQQLGSNSTGAVGGPVGGSIGGPNSGAPGTNADDPTWTLRIEGRFIGATSGDSKFSSFLSAISVDILPNNDYPALQGAPSNIVEWRAGQSAGAPNTSFDGIDIKRCGIFNIKARIALLTRSNAHTLKLSPPMTRFAGKSEATQQEVVYLVWQYVLHKNLLKPIASTPVQAVPSGPVGAAPTTGDPDDDLLAVQCDEVLRPLLNTETFKFVDLYKLLSVHFMPREPVVLEYEVNTRVSTTIGGVVVDIPVELPVQISPIQQELLEFNKTAFESLTRADATISKLNSRISLGIAALQNAHTRSEFYRELADDPVGFIEAWLESQTATLKALKNDEGYDEEVVRRAEYFEENEELVREKIELLLGAGKF